MKAEEIPKNLTNEDKHSKIKYGKFLIEEITEKFLQKDTPYIIMKDFEYIRDCIILYGKQSNLFESALLLLEHNHAEESYILVRSMLNNMMLISYLCDDIDGSRYKNYSVQPEKAYLSFLKDINEAFNRGWLDKEPLQLDKDQLDEKINEYQQYLIAEGYIFSKNKKTLKADTKLLNMREMALTDATLFLQYFMFYRESSKYEHSDISCLEIYKDEIDGYQNSEVFILNLSRTDTVLEEKVLSLAIQIYSMTFFKLLRHINEKHPQLIDEQKKNELVKLIVSITSVALK